MAEIQHSDETEINAVPVAKPEPLQAPDTVPDNQP